MQSDEKTAGNQLPHFPEKTSIQALYNQLTKFQLQWKFLTGWNPKSKFLLGIRKPRTNLLGLAGYTAASGPGRSRTSLSSTLSFSKDQTDPRMHLRLSTINHLTKKQMQGHESSNFNSTRAHAKNNKISGPK